MEQPLVCTQPAGAVSSRAKREGLRGRPGGRPWVSEWASGAVGGCAGCREPGHACIYTHAAPRSEAARQTPPVSPPQQRSSHAALVRTRRARCGSPARLCRHRRPIPLAAAAAWAPGCGLRSPPWLPPWLPPEQPRYSGRCCSTRRTPLRTHGPCPPRIGHPLRIHGPSPWPTRRRSARRRPTWAAAAGPAPVPCSLPMDLTGRAGMEGLGRLARLHCPRRLHCRPRAWTVPHGHCPHCSRRPHWPHCSP